MYYSDFLENPNLQKGLELFASNVGSVMCSQILHLVERQRQIEEGETEPEIQLMFNEWPPYPEIPKNLFSPNLEILDLSILEVARQLTIMEFHYFCKVKAREFFHGGWLERDSRKAANITPMLKRFQMLSEWVKNSIADAAHKLKHQAKTVKHFISLAEHLLKLNNFNGVFAVLTGINKWAVESNKNKRGLFSMVLKSSDVWPELSKRDRKDFVEIEKLMVNEDLYAETLEHVPGHPRIPYVEFHLRKIITVEKEIPSIVGGSMINFSKSKYIYNLISQLIQYQETPFNLQPVERIANLLENNIFKERRDSM